MIISRTPFRVSFFGGGTDYEAWYERHGGAVLSTTIDKYCYLSCRRLQPYFGYTDRIVWSKIETVNCVNEIKHPVVREVMKLLRINGLTIHHDGDLPSRSGLGSSSTFTVGLLNALSHMLETPFGRDELARKAIHVERELIGENVGIQDQIAAAFGGLNKINIKKNGLFEVSPVNIRPTRAAELESNLILVYSGITRTASNIAHDKINSIPNREEELKLMGEMVDEAIKILLSETNISEFGRLLHESWLLKKTLSTKVSPPFINELYDAALAAGATGGKILGAGGGGFMLLFVSPENRLPVIEKLRKLIVLPVKFENSGTKIIFNDEHGRKV